MANWNDLFGGSFNSITASAMQVISSGSSGDLVTITPPAGQKVKLNWLLVAVGTTEAGITITRGGTDWITSKTLSSTSTSLADEFYIGNGIISAIAQTGGCIPPVTFKTNEVVVIKKDTGSITNNLHYNYEFGD